MSPANCPECGGSRWSRYFSETTDGSFEDAFSLCSSCPEDFGTGQPFPESPERRNDLWMTRKVFDYGPEENLRLWQHASAVLEGLVKMSEEWCCNPSTANDALLVALSDCHDRISEEVKRHESELAMRREWAKRQPKGAELL